MRCNDSEMHTGEACDMQFKTAMFANICREFKDTIYRVRFPAYTANPCAQRQVGPNVALGDQHKFACHANQPVHTQRKLMADSGEEEAAM